MTLTLELGCCPNDGNESEEQECLRVSVAVKKPMTATTLTKENI